MDWPYVRTHLSQLAELKETPELVGRLDRLRQSIEER
jgi:hypothetical protein